jgi:uncharacterized membrane protein
LPNQTENLNEASKSRLFWGGVILIVGFMSPLLIPFVNNLDIPDGWKVTLAGLLLAGIPEIFALIAVAIMGKSGYEYLKKSLMNFLHRYGPAERVGIARHRVGVGMFVLPLLVGLLSPYAGNTLPWYAEHELQIAIAADVVFVSSLFVLGGEFWDKLRGLFGHKTKIVLTAK